MRDLLMVLVVGGSLVGCASSHQHAQRPKQPSEVGDSKVATAEPARAKELGGATVKIVAKRPSAKSYKFVGRIEAKTSTNDIVDAAITADAELRRKAKALGADVIKLDVIAPPRDNEHPIASSSPAAPTRRARSYRRRCSSAGSSRRRRS